jgi:hypothetical protein
MLLELHHVSLVRSPGLVVCYLRSSKPTYVGCQSDFVLRPQLTLAL